METTNKFLTVIGLPLFTLSALMFFALFSYSVIDSGPCSMVLALIHFMFGIACAAGAWICADELWNNMRFFSHVLPALIVVMLSGVSIGGAYAANQSRAGEAEAVLSYPAGYWENEEATDGMCFLSDSVLDTWYYDTPDGADYWVLYFDPDANILAEIPVDGGTYWTLIRRLSDDCEMNGNLYDTGRVNVDGKKIFRYGIDVDMCGI